VAFYFFTKRLDSFPTLRYYQGMITSQSGKTLEQSQNFSSTAFGIKESGLSHIFNVLRNQLYSDKILAVIREYSCNAVDAHAEIGKKDTPIEVALPNKLSLSLKIRDFGRGLTDTEISEIYAMYGESTKRSTNEQIGQLGLGCKSAFAYGDNFIINSFVNGIKNSYNAFIDPSEIGQISKLSSEKSDEKSGVEIVIPVKQEDCDSFYRKAVDLFKYFQITPKVTGVDEEQLKKDIELGDIIIEGDSWSIHKDKAHSSHDSRNNDAESSVVMGSISYPLDKSALDIVWNGGEEMRVKDDLLDSGLVIRVKIGELNITANRESLEYTKATKAKLHNRLESIINEIPVLMGKKFSDCKTLNEAKSLYFKAFKQGGFGEKLKQITKSKGIIWNGIKIKDAYYRRETFKESEVNFISYGKPDRWGKGKRVKGEQGRHIICDDDILIVESDTISSIGRMNRIAPLLEEYEGRDDKVKIYRSVTLVVFGSDIQKKKWIAEQNYDGEMTKLSTLPKVKLRDIYPSNSSVCSNGAKSTKHTSKEFVFNFDYVGNQHDNVRSNFFTEEAIDMDEGGVYIGIDKFHVMNRLTERMELHPHHINKIKKQFVKLGLKFPKKVNCFKRAKWDKIENKKNWVCLFDFLEQSVLDYLKEEENKLDYVNFVHAADHYSNKSQSRYGRTDGDAEIIEMFGKLKPLDVKRIACNDSYFLKYYTAYRGMSKCDEVKHGENLSKSAALYSFCNETFKGFWSEGVLKEVRAHSILEDKTILPTHDLKKMNKSFFRTYPMFQYVDDVFYGYNFKNDGKKVNVFKDISNYVNIVDITITHRAKDNIFLQADQIKEDIEKIEEQKKRITQKILDTKSTITHN
jgi:hypothetical protein